MKKNRDEYVNNLIAKHTEPQKRIMLGIPMTGVLRSEWVMARYGQVIPCNWGMVDMLQYISHDSPLRYLVDDARNIIVDTFIKRGFEWLLFIDHDVILPPAFILEVNRRMMEKKPIPVWSGLYFTKSVPSEPLIYRGRGNGYFQDWKFGDEVWVDGLPMGCTLIHRSLLKVMYDEAEEYAVGDNANVKVKRVFITPAKSWYDPELNSWHSHTGTEDLDWCTRVIKGKIFDKAGWPEYQEKQYPFMIDTNLYCKHIDMNGIQYPSQGEDIQFHPEVKKKYGKK